MIAFKYEGSSLQTRGLFLKYYTNEQIAYLY
jgi:hypothetical protein